MAAKRYRDDILGALPDPMLVVDASTLEICYANPAAGRMDGGADEALVGRALLDFFAPAERERLSRALGTLHEGQTLQLREALRQDSGPALEAAIGVRAARLDGQARLLLEIRVSDPPGADGCPFAPAAARQAVLLQGVANATQRLMQAGSFDRGVREALAILGEVSHTDCAAVYQVIPQAAAQTALFVRQQHWVRAPEEAPHLQDFPERLSVQQDGLEALYARLERYEVIISGPAALPDLFGGVFPPLAAHALMIAPIVIGASLWGFIALCDLRMPRVWSGEEASALQTLASSIGAAKHREEYEQQLRHKREVADTLREIGTVLTSTLELDEMLARLLEQARRIVPFDSANVMLLQDDLVRIVHCTGHDRFGTPLEDVRRVEFPLDTSPFIGAILEHGTPVIVPDVALSQAWKHTPGTAHIRCWLGMPIAVRGQVVGLFALDSITPGFYTQEHIQMLLPFAQQAGIAYENVWLYEQQRAQAVELAAHLDQLDALYAAGQSILSTLDLDVILQRFAEQMTRLTRSTSATICDFDRDTRTGVVQANWPEDPPGSGSRTCQPGDRVDFASPLMAPVIQQHEVVRFSADEAQQAFPGKRALGATHELVVVPVFSEARTLGVALLRDGPAHTFTPTDFQTCRALATQAAIAFEQALLFRDIRELERVKSEMICLASHDLRGPLTRLQAYHRLMSTQFETLSPEHRQRMLRQAGETAAEMQRIIEDLLSLERIEEQHRLARPVVWADVVTRALEAVQVELAASRCALTVECAPLLPDGRGDPVRLERALVNLIANAVKYSPQGGPITVRVRAKPYGDTACVTVEVEDAGIGIPLDQQRQLFEPFYRVESAAARFPGLGLGLSVVKAAVSYHNGSVYVESEPGRGSLFGFRIPV